MNVYEDSQKLSEHTGIMILGSYALVEKELGFSPEILVGSGMGFDEWVSPFDRVSKDLVFHCPEQLHVSDCLTKLKKLGIKGFIELFVGSEILEVLKSCSMEFQGRVILELAKHPMFVHDNVRRPILDIVFKEMVKRGRVEIPTLQKTEESEGTWSPPAGLSKGTIVETITKSVSDSFTEAGDENFTKAGDKTMNTIWKFKLEISESQHILIPEQHRILSVGFQGQLDGSEDLCLWATVDDTSPKISKRVEIRGTGHSLKEGQLSDFIGTAVSSGGHVVFHVFHGLNS